MFQAIITWALRILSVLPNLIVNIENLFSAVPKSGPQKWISVEGALAQAIETAANEVAKLAPAGTKAETISAAIAKFTKAANDAFVTLMNELGIFTHSTK